MNSTTPQAATSVVNTLHIETSALANASWHASPVQALAADQIRLRIERFALTANNITYAAFGDAMKYWQFYPVEAGSGVLPVWGFATVVQSLHPGFAVGERIYGFLPFADAVVLSPTRVTPHSFVESAPGRAELAAVYNQYVRCAADPFYAPHNEAEQCLLRPLFITSWLIDDFFADNTDFGAKTLILSSASSKTAYGCAYMMAKRARASGVRVVGLTSEANRAYVEGLGCYDQVISYGELAHIDADEPCAYIDFAGNAALRRDIHTRFTQLKYSCSIGGTHVTAIGNARDLAGPKAILFFAPAQIKKRASEWGGATLNERLVESWQQFVNAIAAASPPWLDVKTHRGLADALATYQAVLAGGGAPALGHVIEL